MRLAENRGWLEMEWVEVLVALIREPRLAATKEPVGVRAPVVAGKRITTVERRDVRKWWRG